MKRITFVLFIILASFVQAQNDTLPAADQLFADRDHSGNLQKAISILRDLAGTKPSYDIYWRLAKYQYYLSELQPDKKARATALEAGMEAARKAVSLDPGKAEGHFWLASNCGEYADQKGIFKSLSLIKTIRTEFEEAFRIDPLYENGVVYLALGQLNLQLPGLLGGDHERGLQLLEKGLKAAPSNLDLKLTLAEIYTKKGRKMEARKLLEDVLSKDDPLATPGETEAMRAKARKQLAAMP
jgi:tetratricopeptide (TPR) repeat protein